MKIMVRLAFLFYVTTMVYLGCFLGLFVLQKIPYQGITDILYVIYYDPQMRLVFGIGAFLILWKNYIYARAISGSPQKGKTIAFDNPVGRVILSLSTMEDLVRRVSLKVPEVKDARTAISAGKKGLEIELSIVLNADVNIPEMTSRLQELVKRKVQDTIGIEEEVVVRVHVIKIIPEKTETRRRKDKEKDDKDVEPPIPFQGYRA